VLIMDQATTIAVIAIIVAAGSEIIAVSPLKSNSWVQLLVKVLQGRQRLRRRDAQGSRLVSDVEPRRQAKRSKRRDQLD